MRLKQICRLNLRRSTICHYTNKESYAGKWVDRPCVKISAVVELALSASNNYSSIYCSHREVSAKYCSVWNN